MINRPYTNFRNERLGKRIDYDWAYGFQCVDPIKLYMDQVLGLGRIGRLGNAKDVPNNPIFRKDWEIIRGMKDLMQWDIIVRTRGKYWHIAIVDHIAWGKIFVLEQNGAGRNSGNGIWPNAMRVKDYSFAFYDTILRNKKIFENLQAERVFADEKIKKLEKEIWITKEYIATTRYLIK